MTISPLDGVLPGSRRFRSLSFHPAQTSMALFWPEQIRPSRPRMTVHKTVRLELRVSTETASGMTPLMERVERILRRLARAKAEMPTNPVLGELMGGLRRQSAARAVDRLHAIGRIRLERGERYRRVHFEDGSATGWGEARPAHKPFCSNAKGEAPKPKERAPMSQPMPAQLPPRPPEPPIVVGPARTCQWPRWGDERPGIAPEFCGERSAPGKSWCPHHDAIVFGRRAIPPAPSWLACTSHYDVSHHPRVTAYA